MKKMNEINAQTFELSKKLEKEGYVRIARFNYGDNWKEIANELIEEMFLDSSEYEIVHHSQHIESITIKKMAEVKE